VQQQVDGVIPQRALAAELVVDPEGEIRQRPGLLQTKNLPPALGRSHRGIRKQRIVIEVKRRYQRRAKRDENERQDKPSKGTTHRDYQALWPKRALWLKQASNKHCGLNRHPAATPAPPRTKPANHRTNLSQGETITQARARRPRNSRGRTGHSAANQQHSARK
jgi:hypothetical protein